MMSTINRWLYSEKIKRKLKSSGEKFRIFLPIDIKGLEYMSIGENFTAHRGMTLQCYDNYRGTAFSPLLEIGDNAYFGVNCHVGCINQISIGDNFLAGGHVYITDHNHGKGIIEEAGIAQIDRQLYSKGAVVIGDNVWLGEHVVILPGVTIGDNVTIGANAVVTKSIPPNCVAAGIPAKIIKYLE